MISRMVNEASFFGQTPSFGCLSISTPACKGYLAEQAARKGPPLNELIDGMPKQGMRKRDIRIIDSVR